MLAIIDYGVGNLFSLRCSLERLGAEVVVTGDPEAIQNADHVILPGVGAFEDAAKKLRDSGLDQVVIAEANSGKPLLGICLGMQMLFEKSYEYGEHAGLGLLNGSVIPMAGTIPSHLQIPHIGWNALHLQKPSPLFRYTKENDCVYFVQFILRSGLHGFPGRYHRIRPGADRCRGKGQCIRLPVPSGKERRCGAWYLTRIPGGMI